MNKLVRKMKVFLLAINTIAVALVLNLLCANALATTASDSKVLEDRNGAGEAKATDGSARDITVDFTDQTSDLHTIVTLAPGESVRVTCTGLSRIIGATLHTTDGLMLDPEWMSKDSDDYHYIAEVTMSDGIYTSALGGACGDRERRIQQCESTQCEFYTGMTRRPRERGRRVRLLERYERNLPMYEVRYALQFTVTLTNNTNEEQQRKLVLY